MTRQQRANLVKGLLFISPWAIGFAAFTAYPIAASLYYSLTDYNIFEAPYWVGSQNYRDLASDKVFWISLGNTLYMILLGVPATLLAGLGLAFLLNLPIRGISLYRTLFYLPSILPEVSVAILWLWLLNSQYGLVNALLALIGIQGPGWLVDPAWAKPAFILLSVWGGSGASMIIYLAALKDVPIQLYEAAELDGASPLQKTWYVTLPMISPVIFFNLTLGIIGMFQYFTPAFIMTDGGPEWSTEFYGLYLYRNAFRYLKMGYASAMAWILFIVTLLATLVVFKSSARWVYYHGELK
ncbi:MAG: sugar ABC transporter permease [Bacillota bacterium]